MILIRNHLIFQWDAFEINVLWTFKKWVNYVLSYWHSKWFPINVKFYRHNLYVIIYVNPTAYFEIQFDVVILSLSQWFQLILSLYILHINKCSLNRMCDKTIIVDIEFDYAMVVDLI